MKASREYKQYNISKTRFSEILGEMLLLSDEELKGLASRSDEFLANYLAESVRKNLSFEKLEAKHGVLPVSKPVFYRRRRLMFHILDEELKFVKKEG